MVWYGLDQALGRGLSPRSSPLGAAPSLAGGAIYVAAVMALRVPEAQQIWRLVRRI